MECSPEMNLNRLHMKRFHLSGLIFLSLEFLCGERVTIKDGCGIIIAHGTYSPDGNIAALEEVTAVINEVTICFEQAHRSGDTLFLLWRPEGMMHTITTAMERKSSY